ncbi:MAG TPA: hypothetical protein VG099_31030 [Gemmataceae bacterium]|nr:hypothetical protein [Gemmataceae bacterium]HEV3449111.1 hypothetical protein [Gemmataceae bacterium]
MSRILALELSDEIYAAIQRQAEASGTTPADLAATLLKQQVRVGSLGTEAEKQAARERFERHFGEIDLGFPTGTDNESIDADLGKEYAGTHEGD